jgi:protein-disulfide isomerase
LSRASKKPVNRTLILGGVTLVAILVVVGLVMGSASVGNDPQTMTGPDASIPRGVTDAGFPFLGNEDAPVTMRIYEDLGCHNCRDFFLNTEPFIIENFVINNKVKIEIYSIAFVNQLSLPGAEAVYCALDQNKFWEYREVLFVNQGVQPFTRQNLVKWAEDLGLNRSVFSNCFDLAVYEQKLVQQSQLAFDIGVNATPTTDINGKRHVGVIPYEGNGEPGMRQFLDEAFANATE